MNDYFAIVTLRSGALRTFRTKRLAMVLRIAAYARGQGCTVQVGVETTHASFLNNRKAVAGRASNPRDDGSSL